MPSTGAPLRACRRHHSAKCVLASPSMFRALFLCAALFSTAALAQDDDLPALPTAKPKPKAPAPRPKARPPAPKPKPPVAADDDLPALPSAQGDLVVKLSPAV